MDSNVGTLKLENAIEKCIVVVARRRRFFNGFSKLAKNLLFLCENKPCQSI